MWPRSSDPFYVVTYYVKWVTTGHMVCVCCVEMHWQWHVQEVGTNFIWQVTCETGIYFLDILCVKEVVTMVL